MVSCFSIWDFWYIGAVVGDLAWYKLERFFSRWYNNILLPVSVLSTDWIDDWYSVDVKEGVWLSRSGISYPSRFPLLNDERPRVYWRRERDKRSVEKVALTLQTICGRRSSRKELILLEYMDDAEWTPEFIDENESYELMITPQIPFSKRNHNWKTDRFRCRKLVIETWPEMSPNLCSSCWSGVNPVWEGLSVRGTVVSLPWQIKKEEKETRECCIAYLVHSSSRCLVIFTVRI